MDPLLYAVALSSVSRGAELGLSGPEGEMGRDHPGFDDSAIALSRDRVVAELVLEHRVKPEDALPPLVEGHVAAPYGAQPVRGSSAIGKLRRPLVSSSSPWKPSRGAVHGVLRVVATGASSFSPLRP